MDEPRPPALSRLLLRAVVRGPDAEFVLGDIEEDFRRECELRGRRRANRWYRRQAWTAIWHWRGREQRGTMEGMTRDLRQAVRALLRAPGYVLATTLTLGLGLGGAVAVLALGASVLSPLPFPEPHRLVSVSEVHRGERRTAAPANYLDWRRDAASFQGLAAYRTSPVSLTFSGHAQRGQGAEVSGNFFQVLGVPPSLGRGFDPGLNVDFAGREAVLSHALWVEAFGGDPGAVGRTFEVDDLTYEVVGVAPEGFEFPEPAVQVWLRSPREAPDLRNFPGNVSTLRDAFYFEVLGRLADEVSLEAATSQMAAVARRLEELHPDTNRDAGVRLTPLLDDTVASFRPTLFALTLAVVLLLLAACVNVAHLALARNTERREAMAVRAALGAGQGALLRYVLAEGWILGLGGSLLGAGAAAAAVRGAVSAFGSTLPRSTEVGVRPGAVAAALVLGVGVTTLVTLLTFRAPGVGRGRRGIRGSLGTRGAASRARDGLMVAQVAAAAALSGGATLVGRSLLNLAQVDPGFDARDLVTLRVSLPDARLRAPEERLQVYRALTERLAAVQGVSAVGLGSTGPLATGSSAGVFLAGAREERTPPNAGWQPVDPGYFAALGIPLLRGRVFDGRDGPGEDVGIVNETLARLRFSGEDPVGRQVTIGLDGHDRPIIIVGVVGDTRTQGPSRNAGPVLFRPMAQTVGWGFSADAVLLAVRAPGAPATLPATLREEIRQAAPGLSVYAVARGEDLVAPFLRGSRGVLLVLGVFAATALSLCAVGVYGVTDYLVRQRRREIGIRLAVGADAARVMQEVMGRGVGRAALGVPLGLILTFALGSALRATLFNVPPTDAVTYGAAGALVLTVAAAALWAPARSAARTDPSTALRGD